MNRETFSPSVFIFDDDPAILDIARRRFYSQTTLGVLTAENLQEARELIESDDIKFDAILSDIAISPEKQESKHGLYSGMDLLALISERRPEVPRYVLSVYSETPTYREESQKRHLDIRQWFQKLTFGGGDEADRRAPWHQIERDLYGERIGSIANAEADDQNIEDAFTETVRQRLHPITRTYLQTLPAPYVVTAPIEVVCRFEDQLWVADALNLGVLQAGVADNLQDALEELGELIASQFTNLRGVSAAQRTGFAEEVFGAFQDHIQVKE